MYRMRKEEKELERLYKKLERRGVFERAKIIYDSLHRS